MKRSFVAIVFAAMLALTQQPSAQSSPHSQKVAKARLSPYQQFRFRMADSEHGPYLAGFSKVHTRGDSSGSSGENPRRMPASLHKNVNITFERGIVKQDSSFAQWLNGSRKPSQARDLVIHSFDEAGQKSSSMYLSGCVIAEYQSVPDLDGAAGSAKIPVMTLHCASMRRSGL